MCGLVGVAGEIYKDEKEVFRELLIVDEIRGPHSTGIGLVHKDGRAGYFKDTGGPKKLFAAFPDDFKLGEIQHSVKVLMGHNRWATVGNVTSANAHPFKKEHILGAHNGTLNKWHLDKLPNHKEFETDSEAIFNSIALDGFEETISRLSGAYALTWFNSNEQALYFVTNGERPLHYVLSKDKKQIFWSSEGGLLDWVLARNGVERETWPIAFPKDIVHRVDIKKGWGPLVVEDIGEFKGYKAPVYVPPFTNGGTKTIVDGGNTTKTSIVSPFKYTRDDLKAAYRSQNGKIVNFFFDGIGKDQNKTPYFAGQLEGRLPLRVRVYGAQGIRKLEFEDSINEFSFFQGKVKKYQGGLNPYLLVSLSSISHKKSIFEVKDEMNVTLPGFHEELTFEQWEKKTADGCGYCGVNVFSDGADKLKWFSDDCFVCEDCAVNEFAEPFLMAYKGA